MKHLLPLSGPPSPRSPTTCCCRRPGSSPATSRRCRSWCSTTCGEIEARGLHLTRGYGSLFDYVVRELGYTAAARVAADQGDAAMQRYQRRAGSCCRTASLNLSNAAQLQNLFERSDRNDRSRGRHGTSGGMGGEPQSDGAPGEPTPSAPTRAGERDPAPGVEPVLDAAAREELVKQAAGKSTREVQQMVAEVDPELAQPSDRMRALGQRALGVEGSDSTRSAGMGWRSCRCCCRTPTRT